MLRCTVITIRAASQRRRSVMSTNLYQAKPSYPTNAVTVGGDPIMC